MKNDGTAWVTADAPPIWAISAALTSLSAVNADAGLEHGFKDNVIPPTRLGCSAVKSHHVYLCNLKVAGNPRLRNCQVRWP